MVQMIDECIKHQTYQSHVNNCTCMVNHIWYIISVILPAVGHHKPDDVIYHVACLPIIDSTFVIVQWRQWEN